MRAARGRSSSPWAWAIVQAKGNRFFMVSIGVVELLAGAAEAETGRAVMLIALRAKRLRRVQVAREVVEVVGDRLQLAHAFAVLCVGAVEVGGVGVVEARGLRESLQS